MIKQFDRPTIRDLRDAVNKVLEPVAEEFGIGIKAGNASFTPTEVTLKLACGIKNADGVVETKERQDFRLKAAFLGLSADDLDMEFDHHNGDRYKIVGMKPRSTKYPIICQRAKDGKQFKFPVNTIKFMKDMTKAKQTFSEG